MDNVLALLVEVLGCAREGHTYLVYRYRGVYIRIYMCMYVRTYVDGVCVRVCVCMCVYCSYVPPPTHLPAWLVGHLTAAAARVH